MFFQRQFFSRLGAWHLRTLHSCSGRVACRVLVEDLRLAGLEKLANNNATNISSNFSSPFTSPLRQTSISSLQSRSGVFSVTTQFWNPNINVKLGEITLPQRRIQELIFPVHLPNVGIIIGDQESHELTVGDDVRDTPIVAFSSILKKRHKKMNKHKYRKRRKRDVFKRRNLENTKLRKKRAKEKKEERIQQREALD